MILLLVLFLNKINSAWLEKIAELKREFPNVRFENRMSVEKPRTLISESDIVVSGRMTHDEIMGAKKLKLIVVPFAGVNSLDWEAIRRKRVPVANCHANAASVAERALALCLSLLGRVVEYDRDLRRGIWHGYSAGNKEEDLWTSIRNKTICIVGMGHIGEELKKLLTPFGCRVIGVKRSAPAEKSEITSDLNWAIESSEVIFVTVPLTASTKGMFNADLLMRMKGKYLINISRGEVIDESALYFALKRGVLRGAAIDTWYLYPDSDHSVMLPSRFPFNTLSNIVLSPHVGGYCYEGISSLIEETVENIKSFLKSGKPLNLVNPQNEY